MPELKSYLTPLTPTEIGQLGEVRVVKPKNKISFDENKRIELKKYLTPLSTEDKAKFNGLSKETFNLLEPVRIREEDDSWSKMNKFQKFLDVIGRPGQALKNALFEAASIKNYTQLLKDGIINKEEFLSYARAGNKKIFAKAWEGLSGQDRESANVKWERMGVSGVPLLGFITDVVTDPLMYGGYNAITKGIGKLAKLIFKEVGVASKVMSKGIEKIPVVGEKYSGAIAKVPEIVSGFKERFVTKSGIKDVNDLIDKYLSKMTYLTGKEYGYAVKTRNVIQRIAKNNKIKVKEAQNRIVNIIELRNHPKELASIVPNISVEEKVLANTLKSHWDNMLIKEMDAGVNILGLGYIKSAKIAKLRKNLNVLRNERTNELQTNRALAIRELDIIGELKTRGYVSQLRKGKKVIEDKLRVDNVNNIKKIDANILSVEKQIDIMEKQRMGLVKMKVRLNPKGKDRSKLTERVGEREIVKVEKQLDKLENQFWYLHGEMAERLQGTDMGAKAATYVKSIKDIEKLLRGDIEVNLGRTGAKLANQINRLSKKMGKLSQTPLGIPEGETKSLLKQLTIERAKRDFGYAPRYTTNQVKEYLQHARIGHTKVWNKFMSESLNRRTNDFTAEEFNAFVEGFGLKGLGGKSIDQYFMTNPAYSVARRGASSAKAITSANFLDEVGKLPGVLPKDKAPEFFVQLPDRVLKLNPSLRNKMFSPELAGEISRVSKSYLDPAQAKYFRQFFDTVQNSWKRWTLAIFPEYHIRNAVSNVWNIYLEGSTRPKHFLQMQALQTYRKYNKSPTMGKFARAEIKKLGIAENQAIRWIDEMEQLGVLGQGWYAADIKTASQQVLNKKDVIKFGMSVGTTIENNARGALYLARMGKGDDIYKAATTVKKYLFDYTDLTSFEREVMKRAFPFWTWTRKNMPLQIENLWKQPQKYAPLATLLRKNNVTDLLRLKYTRPDLYDRAPIEYKRNVDSVTYIPLEGLIAAGDLAKIVRPQDLLWDMFTPFGKAGVELLFNKVQYFDSEIERYPEATQKLLRMDISARTKYLLTTVLPQARLLKKIDKLVRKKRKNEALLTLDEKIFQSTLSSVYKTSIEELKRRSMMTIGRKIKKLKSGGRSAERQGNKEELGRIRETLKDVYKEMEDIR